MSHEGPGSSVRRHRRKKEVKIVRYRTYEFMKVGEKLFSKFSFVKEIAPHMESRRPRLLCYGHDDMLLYTRKCILESDFSVEICTGLTRLGECLRAGPVRVVVICHSVSDQECKAAIEMARAAWPGIKILTLREGDHEECSLHADKSMDHLDGPPALLYKVHSLLGTASADKPSYQ